MDIFNAYLRTIIGGNSISDNITDEEKLYISSFYTDGEMDKERVYTELNKVISYIVTRDEKSLFFDLLDTILSCPDIDYKIVDILEPLMISFRPRMSELLERSHLFCPCYEYKSGPVNNWRKIHDTVEHELEFWKYLIETYREYIEIDIDAYPQKNVLSKKKNVNKCKEHDRKEKLKQLYSCALYVNC